MKCIIEKEKLEEKLSINNESFGIMTINNNIGIIKLTFISNITINHGIIKKEDIFVGLVKIIEGTPDNGIPVAFQTNITSIPNLNSII